MSKPLIITAIFCTVFLHSSLTVECLVRLTGKRFKISRLPHQPSVNVQQYSGYITVNSTENKSLFFYFAEAETSPESQPLLLWLNGGPGCSSVGLGAFTEHGPFIVKGDILVKNEYSWNKVANVLYLESPAGVGFSYANESFNNYLNDTLTAQDTFAFLQLWVFEFSQYSARDFYIAGESYAGHYVPQLAQLILKQKSLPLKLKGIALGNPSLQFNTDQNARDLFLWSHGLISDDTYQYATTVCNSSRLYRLIFRRENITTDCQLLLIKTETEVGGDAIDLYDVTGNVCLSAGQAQSNFLTLRSRLQHLSFYQSQLEALNNQQVKKDADPCILNEMTKYFNRKDVQTALHARLVGVPSWGYCNSDINEKLYDQSNRELPTIGIVGSLVQSGLRVLVYNGDQDAVIPFLGTRTLIRELATQLKLRTIEQYRPWFQGKQVGGWTEVYAKNLTYATIRGASHTAPTDQPERSFALFKAFIVGYSPPKK